MSTHPLSPREAREQAAECLGFMASQPIQIGDEVFEVPHPSLLDDDQQTRYDELQLSLEDLQRWPDIKDADGNVLRQGDPKDPHRTQDGKLVESYNIRLAKALFGDVAYKKFKAGGGSGNTVAAIWFQMQRLLSERVNEDSKSMGRDSSVGELSESD
jgi:hypothetical protein